MQRWNSVLQKAQEEILRLAMLAQNDKPLVRTKPRRGRRPRRPVLVYHIPCRSRSDEIVF